MGMVFLVVIIGIGAWFLWDALAVQYRAILKRQAGTKIQIEDARRWISQKELWDQRSAWMTAELKPAGSPNEAGAKFLEQLRKAAESHKLTIGQQGLLEAAVEKEFVIVGAKLVFQGGLKEAAQFLAEIQQPGDFVEVNLLELRPLKEAGQVECMVQLKKWHAAKAAGMAQVHIETEGQP